MILGNCMKILDRGNNKGAMEQTICVCPFLQCWGIKKALVPFAWMYLKGKKLKRILFHELLLHLDHRGLGVFRDTNWKFMEGIQCLCGLWNSSPDGASGLPNPRPANTRLPGSTAFLCCWDLHRKPQTLAQGQLMASLHRRPR